MTNEQAIQELMSHLEHWERLKTEHIARVDEATRTIDALLMAIEALSERTGEWIWSDEDMSWKCGNCGCVFEEIDWKPEYNYCPNCGAMMMTKGDDTTGESL